MPIPIEYILLGVSLLVLLSVLASKVSDKFGVPALLLFLLIGMLAGAEGPGKIYFYDLWGAKSIGIIALIFILFSGGLETNWKEIKPILGPGIILSSAGVLLTTIILGCFLVFILHFSFLEGLLLGAIVSSTDATAVFSILRSRRVGLKGQLRPLLEFESGSNDPMAVFLTIGLIRVITNPAVPLVSLIPMFFLEMGIGAIVGFAMARLSIMIIERIRLEYSGLYPVLTTSLILLTYAISTVLKGNGVLAVYLAGIVLSSHDFIHKKTIRRFHEGIAWLMQIVMFLTLGLLVVPSQIIPVVKIGLLISLILMLIARPISVFLCLSPFRINLSKKAMISWVGLRGAIAIILATFPLIANIPHASMMFNLVFFVVLTSILIQGTSIPWLSKWLKVSMPLENQRYSPLEFEKSEGLDANLTDVIVPYE